LILVLRRFRRYWRFFLYPYSGCVLFVISTARGINVTSTGHASIFPRPGGVLYIKGKDDFTATPSSGKATYTFEAIGNYGVALFKPNATGSLSFLSNTVAVYKVDKNSNGANTFTMWKWGR
jgi:hypothetical protein